AGPGGVLPSLHDALPIWLAGATALIGIAVSFPLGIAAALRRGKVMDGLISIFSLLGQSVPSFWLGIMLILVFARRLQVLPSAGSDRKSTRLNSSHVNTSS